MPPMLLMALGAALAATEATTVKMEFLGFSANDRSCAWRLTLASPNPLGGSDRYRLVQLVDIANNRLVANFRDGPGIERRDGRGRLVRASTTQLARQHPDWRAAASAAMWRQARAKGHFASHQVDFKGALVRLVPDADSHFTLAADERTKLLGVRHTGGAFGFTPVASLLDGGLLPLGHFRLGEGARASTARLAVYHSKTGCRVAALATFEGAGPDAPAVQVGGAVFATADDNPLGTTQTGSFAVMEQQSQSVEAIFKRMHPGGGHNWDVYVGRWF